MAISPLWLMQDCFVGLASDLRVHEDGGAASRTANLSFRSWLLLAPDFAAGFQQCDQGSFHRRVFYFVEYDLSDASKRHRPREPITIVVEDQ